MITRNTIKFKVTELPISDVVTKFGGQPNWLEEAQWPISSEMDSPMRFICQIKLTNDLFPGCEGKVAYIFMTDDDEYVDGTWEPDGGENAVIIQPGGKPQIKVRNITTGPTLQDYVEVKGKTGLYPIDIELAVDLSASKDPEFIPEAERFDLADEDYEKYCNKLGGNKIGGTPSFLQGDEFPGDTDDWSLLMQLDSCEVPFSINFGDSGVSYAFINKEGTIGKFLWQCC
ncbi:DUF1963 domain-containing protein [Microbulbifer sp. JMSA008]|uniref:DUF1963 domain-containing protein n=1 Tax=Microbulbifer sp. JMSA008 TaxID=3243373 RepID=UPI004039C739